MTTPSPRTHQSSSIEALVTSSSDSFILSGQENKVYLIRHAAHSRGDGPNSMCWICQAAGLIIQSQVFGIHEIYFSDLSPWLFPWKAVAFKTFITDIDT